MEKNNKGFMLVEVIIVTVVVVTIMTSLYMVFNRVYNAYDKKGSYTDIDTIYALKMLEDFMIDTEENNSFMFNNLLNKINTTNDIDGDGYVHYLEINCDEGSNEFKNYCQKVKEEYQINKIYIIHNNNKSFEKLKEEVTNQTFKDYLDYLVNIGITSSGFIEDGFYDELLIAEAYTLDDDKNSLNKYAYLPIRLVIPE